MTNFNNIKEWLSSGEYQSDIDSLCTAIIKGAELSQNESQTANVFESNLYDTIQQRTGWKVNFSKKTKGKNTERHLFGEPKSRKSGKGILNNLIIKYKHSSKLKTEKDFDKAVEQVEDNLKALLEKKGEKFHAILTDGIRIAYFRFHEDAVTHSNLRQLNSSDIDFIIRAIVNHNKKQFVPVNIVNDFSIDIVAGSLSTALVRMLYHCLTASPTDKTKMLFQEWANLMHLSVNDNGKANDISKRRHDLSLILESQIDTSEAEYLGLFALQTTYAIIIKLIACKIVDKIRLDTFLNLTGGGILNFLEDDFFSWYSAKEQYSSELWKVIRQMIEIIEQYSAFSFDFVYHPVDIFKDLYMSIIPRSIRHSMGEYFTPEWVADRVISKSITMIDKPDWKAIDPCCGSGIFIITLMKHLVGDIDLTTLSAEEKAEIRKQILSRIHGIDINPLSVLSARVGYFIALQPFGEMKNIEIPIYLGDSAIVPQVSEEEGIECYTYTVRNEKMDIPILFPSRFVKSKDFGQKMNQLQAIIKTDDSQIVYESLMNELSEEEKSCKTIVDGIETLSHQLTTLQKNNWDGIWIRIITNFMLIARLEKCDMIVGNPPWVKWEHLPESYASKIKEECNIRHIFSRDGQFGGTQLNICALIANVSAANWLSEKGVLAFLMPDSIMSQNSYEGFRDFYIDYENGKRLYLQCIDRWLKPLRPFQCGKKAITQDFNTYYYSFQYVDYAKGFPVLKISKSKEKSNTFINTKLTYETARPYLMETQSKAVQLSGKTTVFSYVSGQFDFSKIIGETSYLYRTGVEFTPQEIYLLNISGESELSGHYRFASKRFRRSKYKIEDTPDDGWDLPTKYIYPILTAPNITPFHYTISNDYGIIPYEADNTRQPVSQNRLLKDYPELYNYLVRHKDMIDMQSEKSKQMHRGTEFYSLSKIGEYTFADNIVATRDNTHFCATVVAKGNTPWNEQKQTICVKHTILISQRTDGKFISEEEAYYIAGILNSTIVVAYIESAFKSNGFSLNKSNLYIPCFDENNELHKKIVSLSKEATNSRLDDEIAGIQEKLTDLYIELCERKQ